MRNILLGKESPAPEMLRIPPLKEPVFEAHIKQSDLKTLDSMSKSEEAILLALSLVDQKTQFCVNALLNVNNQMRYMESEQIRINAITDTVALTQRVIKWICLTFSGGALVTAGAYAFKFIGL